MRRLAASGFWVLVIFVLTLGLLDLPLLARSCGPPPAPKPHRRTGGESFPPLPLPATPLRRTERKKPPQPPALVGKIQYGEKMWVQRGNTRTVMYDSTTDPADMVHLLSWAGGQLGVRYRVVEFPLSEFSFDPEEIPILYISGHEPISFTEQEHLKLRQYLQDGGYLIADACCGSEDFVKSFREEMKKVFPQRPLLPLPKDHPIWDAFYSIRNVTYQIEGKGVSKGPAYLEGIDIGCRTAVFFTPFDLSCGWSGHEHPHGARVGVFRAVGDYDVGDARQIGANIITYCLANYQLGRFFSTEKVYYQAGEEMRDELVFGQVVHGGDWDPDPQAVANLLKYVKANTTMDVQFRRESVDLRHADAFRFPFLYMTGHRDFEFSEEEVQCLRAFFKNGGVLLADACCGREAFDRAFRREIAKVLPEFNLEPIPLNHPLYGAALPIQQVSYTPFLNQLQPDLTTPRLEGISIGGALAVIYSKYDLGCGWEGQLHPYGKGYSSLDALRIGADCIVYALTH